MRKLIFYHFLNWNYRYMRQSIQESALSKFCGRQPLKNLKGYRLLLKLCYRFPQRCKDIKSWAMISWSILKTTLLFYEELQLQIKKWKKGIRKNSVNSRRVSLSVSEKIFCQTSFRPTCTCSKQWWKHSNNVWNLFEVNNKDTRTMSMTLNGFDILLCPLLTWNK